MPRFYLTTAFARADWEVTHERGVYCIEAVPHDAAGSALHVGGLSREDAEAIVAGFLAAFKQADTPPAGANPSSDANVALTPEQQEASNLPRDGTGLPLWVPTAALDAQRHDTTVEERLQRLATQDHARLKAGIEPRDCSGGPIAEMNDVAGAVHSNDQEEPYKTGQDEPMPF